MGESQRGRMRDGLEEKKNERESFYDGDEDGKDGERRGIKESRITRSEDKKLNYMYVCLSVFVLNQ